MAGARPPTRGARCSPGPPLRAVSAVWRVRTSTGLGLRVLPDVASSSLRAYLVASGIRPTVEEYFVDDVYRTAFDKDDYSSIQLEVLLN